MNNDYDRDFASHRFARRLPQRYPISDPVTDTSWKDRAVFWVCIVAGIVAVLVEILK